MNPTIAIMAGGRSRRMGRDKAMLPFGERTLLEQICHAALSTGLPVLVAGRERPVEWAYPSVEFIPDRWPDNGPLGGIATALAHTGGIIAAVACDMPFVTPDALRWLIDLARVQRLNDGLIVNADDRIEPLFSLYMAAALPLIEHHLASSDRSLHTLISTGRFEHVTAPPEIASTLRNLNTPDDYSHALS